MAAALTSGNCCDGTRKPRGELRWASISVGILEIAPGSTGGRKEMVRRSQDAPSTPPCWRRLPGAYRIDLLVGRKPAGLLLGESEPAIDGNLKHPADPGHQLDIGAVFLLQPIPRTEGTRFIVSGFAPLDSDFHRSSSLVRNDGAVLPRGFRSFQARRRNARWHRERLEKAGAARGIAGDHLGCGADAHRRPERCAADSGPRGRSGNGSPAGHGLF